MYRVYEILESGEAVQLLETADRDAALMLRDESPDTRRVEDANGSVSTVI